jgi:hypothetical protein
MIPTAKTPLYARITRTAREELKALTAKRRLNNVAAMVETLIKEAAARELGEGREGA